MEKTRYSHLFLKEWPFRIVPDEEFCSFMADRKEIVKEIDKLLNSLSFQPCSNILLMWAWYGAGKTHTLRYIEYLCRNYHDIIPIYIEFPKSVKSFIDIYREFISKIDINILKNAFLEVFSDPSKSYIQDKLRFDLPDLSNAMLFLYQGDPEQQDISIRWLRADCKERNILRKINIMKAVQTSEDTVKIIAWLISLINSCKETSDNNIRRICLMIDEYQRIETLKRSKLLDEINGCLHSIFNRCPNGLTMIISFAGYPEQKRLPSWISPEIKDRIGTERPLLLPPLSIEEANNFVKDLIFHFRDDSIPKDLPKYYPFDELAIDKAIKTLIFKTKSSRSKGEPKPRTIMHFFNSILIEANTEIKDGKLMIIDQSFITKVLKNINIPEEE